MVKKWDWRRVKSILFYSQIFCSQMNNFNPNMLRSKVGALLAEVPNGRLQVIFQISESLLFAEKECRETILNLDPSFRFSSCFGLSRLCTVYLLDGHSVTFPFGTTFQALQCLVYILMNVRTTLRKSWNVNIFQLKFVSLIFILLR